MTLQKKIDRIGKRLWESDGSTSERTIFIQAILQLVRKEIGVSYKKWAKSHTPTWETDNLVHDLMGNPNKGVFLYKPELKEIIKEL